MGTALHRSITAKTKLGPNRSTGQFSREARAHSTDGALTGLPAIVKSNKYYVSRYLKDSVSVRNAKKVTSGDQFKKGNAVYLIVGEDWNNMQLLAVKALSELGGNYAAVITATEAVDTDEARTRRMAFDRTDMTGSLSAANGSDYDMPLNLPPYNRTEQPDPVISKFGSCMLYSEGVNIVVWKNVSGTTNKFASIPVRSLTNTTTWTYTDGDVICDNSTNGTYQFTVRLNLKEDVTDKKKLVKISKGSSIVLTLIFTGTRGWWDLTNVKLGEFTVEDNGEKFISGPATVEGEVISNRSVYNVGFHSVLSHAMGCSDTQAAFFKTNLENVLIGISLHNTEVQAFGVFPDKNNQKRYFTTQVEDCVGTFSVGSWMIIITFLAVFGGVLFGYLMLNSIQTMDRLDDPKHPQIVINVNE